MFSQRGRKGRIGYIKCLTNHYQQVGGFRAYLTHVGTTDELNNNIDLCFCFIQFIMYGNIQHHNLQSS